MLAESQKTPFAQFVVQFVMPTLTPGGITRAQLAPLTLLSSQGALNYLTYVISQSINCGCDPGSAAWSPLSSDPRFICQVN